MASVETLVTRNMEAVLTWTESTTPELYNNLIPIYLHVTPINKLEEYPPQKSNWLIGLK